ncbi:MAG TPA: hypothetical protein VL049_15300 [Candidatus Dormibacteraeota bacterium]|nr:hypothetical protein [Candidatus Dormibacteraeota bacterium]
MFWYPYTGSIPYALDWSAGPFTTGLAVAAAVGVLRVALLALRPQYGHGGPRSEAVSVPFHPVVVDDQEPEVKQAAA